MLLCPTLVLQGGAHAQTPRAFLCMHSEKTHGQHAHINSPTGQITGSTHNSHYSLSKIDAD